MSVAWEFLVIKKQKIFKMTFNYIRLWKHKNNGPVYPQRRRFRVEARPKHDRCWNSWERMGRCANAGKYASRLKTVWAIDVYWIITCIITLSPRHQKTLSGLCITEAMPVHCKWVGKYRKAQIGKSMVKWLFAWDHYF